MPERIVDSPTVEAVAMPDQCVVFVRTSSTARLPVYKHLADSCGYPMVMMHPEEVSDFSPMFKHWVSCETNDVDVLEAELRFAMKEKGFIPSAIVSFDEYGVYPAAQLCERFDFRPLPLNPEGLRNTTIKSAFRDWCVEHKIGTPKFAKLSRQTDVAAAISHLTFPVVVKPSPGAGSMLTTRVATESELYDCLPGLWAALENHPALIHLEALGTKVHLLVEEYVGGQEVDIDCVVENGVVRFCAISDNFEVKPPYFCEQGGLTPSALDKQAQNQLKDLLLAFVASHGSQLHGVLHFEAKYDFQRGQAYVIEVNVRPGSAETHTMVSTVYGVHLGECVVRLALGETLEDLHLEDATPRGYCASVNVYPEREGIVSSLSVPHSESLVQFMPLPVGSAVAPPPTSFALMAWMVARGPTAQSAVENLNKLTAAIDVKMCEAKVLGHTVEIGVENSSFAL